MNSIFRSIAKLRNVFRKGCFDPLQQRGRGIGGGEENRSDQTVENGEEGQLLRLLVTAIITPVDDQGSVGRFGIIIFRHCLWCEEFVRGDLLTSNSKAESGTRLLIGGVILFGD